MLFLYYCIDCIPCSPPFCKRSMLSALSPLLLASFFSLCPCRLHPRIPCTLRCRACLKTRPGWPMRRAINTHSHVLTHIGKTYMLSTTSNSPVVQVMVSRHKYFQIIPKLVSNLRKLCQLLSTKCLWQINSSSRCL